MDKNFPSPVALGGIGGSGTRVGAALLDILGYYLGDDLNEMQDNLWFTLLFKRRTVLLESDAEFRALAELFFRRMSSDEELSRADRERIIALAREERLQHSYDWLLARAITFSSKSSKRISQSWSWKEPNTHIVIERILKLKPDLRYIHMFRDPLDMSINANQNQLQNWGPIFLNRDVSIGPRDSLAYWCESHRRIINMKRRWPNRVMLVNFNALCADPEEHCDNITRFLGIPATEEAVVRFKRLVVAAESAPRHAGIDLVQFYPKDLAYIQEVGLFSPEREWHHAFSLRAAA